MKKITAVSLLFFCLTASAQWTPWGLGLIQRPNALTGRIYIGVTNVSQGTNIILYFNPVNGTIVINSTGGGGGGSGTNGVNGTNATITVGTTTTLSPGSPATVVNVGTSLAAILNFGIPEGVAGATGPQGPPGTDGTNSGSLRIQEVDGSPLVNNVTNIVVSNGTLTDDGDGNVTITTGGGGGGDFIDELNGRGTNTFLVDGTMSAGQLEDSAGNPVMDVGQGIFYDVPGTNSLNVRTREFFNSSGDVIGFWSTTFGGNGSLWTNLSPIIATNNSSASDGDVLSKTGNHLKLIPVASGSATVITNEGGIHSLIASSNLPTVGLKSISAGSNVTITDQGTNLVLASSGGGGSDDFYDGSEMFFAYGGSTGSATPIPVGVYLSAAASGSFGHAAPDEAAFGASSYNTSATINADTYTYTPPIHDFNFKTRAYWAISSATTSRRVWLILSPQSASPTTFLSTDSPVSEFVGFRLSTGGGNLNWYAVSGDGVSVMAVDTGVATTTAIQQIFTIEWDQSPSEFRYYINRNLVATINTNMPSTNAVFGNLTGIRTLANSGRTLRVSRGSVKQRGIF